jgi:hypothetical protein
MDIGSDFDNRKAEHQLSGRPCRSATLLGPFQISLEFSSLAEFRG